MNISELWNRCISFYFKPVYQWK